MEIASDDETHGGWTLRDDELDDLAASMLGLTPEAAQPLADAHGVELRVCDELGRVYTKAYRFGRVTVDAYDGVITRASRG